MATAKVKFQCPGCKMSTSTIVKLPSENSHRKIETKCEGCESSLKVVFTWKNGEHGKPKGQLNVAVQISFMSKLLHDMLIEEAQIRAGAKTPEEIENEKTKQA